MIKISRINYIGRYISANHTNTRPWYLQDGISLTNCIAAYQPKGAASLAGSYINLANPGVYNASPGIVPTWNPYEGWIFNGAQYLTTGIIPETDQTWSMICGFKTFDISNAIGRSLCGSIKSPGNGIFYLYPRRGVLGDDHIYGNGAVNITGIRLVDGTMAIAGANCYLDGVADGICAAWNTIALAIYIGAVNANGAPAEYWAGIIDYVAIYDIVLTIDQINAVINAAKNNHAPIGDNISYTSALEWFQKPAAIRFVGMYDRTYFSWISIGGIIECCYYDHDSSSFSRTYQVDNLYTDYGPTASDDHNAPSMLILPSGKIQLYYFVHDTNNAFCMKESTNIEDITSWSSRVDLSDGAYQHSYPQVKRKADGSLIMFYRRGDYADSDEYYKKSADNGATWGVPTQFIDFGAQGIYAFATIANDIIHVAWNKSNAGRFNIYYAYSDDWGISWKKRDGTLYTLPIVEVNAEVVFNSGAEQAYVWDIRADATNNPFIVFAHKLEPAHEFRFAKYSGGAWVTSQITTSEQIGTVSWFYSGGVVIDPNNMYRVALSKKQTNLEIETWISVDSGATWAVETQVTTGSSVDNFRMQWIENYDASIPLIWCSGTYTGLLWNEWIGYFDVNIHCETTKGNIP